jgi:outer membrane protein assembly factor BamA
MRIPTLFILLSSLLHAEPLFNGKDLSNWRIDSKSKAEHWTVKKGVIHCTSGPKKAGSVLWTKNSGVMLKKAHDQIQIGISGSLKRDLTASPYIPGKGYPVEGKEAIAAVKPKDWNTLKIEVTGSTYKTWLNGVEGITYTSKTAIEKGPLGLQLHGGKNMAISFRNIEIAEKAE